AKPLADHRADFIAVLRAKGTDRHAQLTGNRIRAILDACGFRYPTDLSPGKVQTYLNDLRADKPEKRGISARSYNAYLGAIKAFTRWLVRERRLLENPLAHLQGLNVRLDKRHERRAFTVDELIHLLDVTRRGPDRNGMAGVDRWLLYWLAVE